MKEKDNKKADVVATITQNKIYWNSEEVANEYEETNNSVSAPDLTAGTWEGIFQMEIRLETDNSHTHNFVDGACTECGEADPNAEHQHNYVDGKCECGEVDPNHTHNYVDGTCTICGKETDPYETAPAEAYSNWNYTLDDTSNIITLNYYTGSETDVIVYANYPINGKTYRTQLASSTCTPSEENKQYMFNGSAQENCRNIKTIIFSDNIDTSNVTNMTSMFKYCIGLINLKLGNFNTSNVISMRDMFSCCSLLVELDLSSFDTSKVTDMSDMFDNCSSLTSLNVTNFNTSKVTNMNWMFNQCKLLNNLDVRNFDTSKVTNMLRMFNGCSSLESLDLSSFDTHNVTQINYMFSLCSNLKVIYVTKGKWSTSQINSMDMLHMFTECGCSSVTYID